MIRRIGDSVIRESVIRESVIRRFAESVERFGDSLIRLAESHDSGRYLDCAEFRVNRYARTRRLKILEFNCLAPNMARQ